MLTVYRSNRAEWLANVLSEQLRLTPPELFETVDIIVNTWPTSRWLGEQLATANEISALVRYPFPGTHLRQLVKLVLGIDDDEEDPWKANRLVWDLLDVLPELLKSDEAGPIKEWINQHPSQPGQLNREKWQLVRTIADAFDDYALYRADLISNWLKGIDPSSSPLKGQITKKDWQPLLMRLLQKHIDREPFGLQVKQAISKLKRGESPAKKLPERLYIFGLSSLAPVQVELIQALSCAIDIKFFLLTPCRDLWHRCEVRREKLGQEWTDPPDGNWLLNSPRLEANLGRMGAEFQQLLEGSGENQLGELQEGDLFAAPATIACQSKRDPTLLEELQQQLVNNDAQKPLQSFNRNKEDTSLLFLACPGQLRQVQLVRDQILQWLAKDPSLEPRDILIMTPQVKRYAPLIASVFNDVTATNVLLPWRITDRSQQDIPGLSQCVLELLLLSGKRLNASTLDSLLTNPAIQTQKDLNQDDSSLISDYLQKTGFRWGIDAEDRDGDEIHSLSWCLDRWLLGLVLPQKPGLAPGGVAPFSKGIAANDLLKWWNLLSQFCNLLKELRRPRTCEQWIDLLKTLVKDLFDDGGPWRWELKSFLSALEDWRQVAGKCQLKLEASVVADVLTEALTIEVGRFGHRTGVLTISALEPMRAIPHKVIVLMGLDADVFPRQKDRPGFHLFNERRELGDPRSNDQDRYVLLEALMSTRQHLLITWNSRNEKTGEPIPAANPVQQWLGQLKNDLGDNYFKGLLREPHPNALARENFLPTDNSQPISCDARNFNARLLIEKNNKKINLALALPLKWHSPSTKEKVPLTNEQLKAWLIAPQSVWLEQYQLQPKEWINPLQNLESLDLNELERQRLLRERLEELVEVASTSTNSSFNNIGQESWVHRYAGQGKLPPTAAASIECELLEKRWQNLLFTLQSFGPLKKQLLDLTDGSEEILWAGDVVTLITLGKLKWRTVMEGWLSHLHTCATNNSPLATVVIARHSSKFKKDQFDIALQWNPVSAEIAKGQLSALQNLAYQGLKECWPIPPKSGWALAQSNQLSHLKGEKAFQKEWEGSFNIPGECEEPEMQLCFGVNYKANNFLCSEEFKSAYSMLFIPLLQSLGKRKGLKDWLG